MNSFGDNRSSKILFGKRKYCPLQFLFIRKPPSKLFERIFCRVKTKKKNTIQKNSLYYTEKNFNFVRVFCKILYTLFTFNFTIEKIPLYNTEKNSSFVDVFLEKIFDLVLKFTRLSIAMLFVKSNYDIMIILRVLLTRARSGEVQYENNIHEPQWIFG